MRRTKLILAVSALLLTLITPATADTASETENVRPTLTAHDLINLGVTGDGATYVTAGVSRQDRSATVTRTNANGAMWTHSFKPSPGAGASFHFGIALDISDDLVAVGGRRHHPLGGYSALMHEDEILWQRTHPLDPRDVAIYPSGESVWAGWNAETNTAGIAFVSASGAVVWEKDFSFGYPSRFDSVVLDGTTIVLRATSLCGQQSICPADDEASTRLMTLDTEGNVLKDVTVSLVELFGVQQGFRTSYPRLTASAFAATPDGGYALTGLAMRIRGEYCLVVATLNADFRPVSHSEPLFCDNGAELMGHRASLEATRAGELIVGVTSYRDTSVAGPSLGLHDFVVAVLDGLKLRTATQFGTPLTDMTRSVGVFDGSIVMTGATASGNVTAELKDVTVAGPYRRDAVSPNMTYTPDTPVVLTPSPPEDLAVTRSATGVNLSWVGSASEDVSYYQAELRTISGDLVNSCIARSSQSTCVIPLQINGEYRVLLSAVNRHGSSPAVERSISVSFDTPTAPRNISVDTQPGRIDVRFVEPEATGGARITRYLLEIYDGDRLVRTVATARNRRHTIVTRLPDGEYQVRMAATNARGTGDWSALTAINLTFSAPTAPTAVDGYGLPSRIIAQYAHPVSNGGIAVSGYQIEVYANGRLVASQRNRANRNQFTVSRMASGTYLVRVAAQNARGVGEWSEFVTVVVP